MLIDDHYRECVCFLCVEVIDDQGVVEKVERATGFLVSIPLDDRSAAPYLITARHVIEESRKVGPLYAKINLKNGGIRYVQVPQDSWTSHHSSDVAAIPFRDEGDECLKFIPSSLFADDSYLKWSGINPGDEVFFIGLFAAFTGEHQAEPIVRFGHVALGLKEIPVKPNSVTEPTKMKAYLVETKSWGGESGSSVFHCKWPYSPTVPISSTNPRLIGLLHGRFEIPKKTSGGAERIALNSGVGIVIPMEIIWDLLSTKEFEDQREKLKKEIDTRLGGSKTNLS